MTQPSSFPSDVSPVEFIASAIKATTSSDVEKLLARLPITPEDDYIYDESNPEAGWRPGFIAEADRLAD